VRASAQAARRRIRSRDRMIDAARGGASFLAAEEKPDTQRATASG
jgi:hypothetical protein